MKTNLPPDDPAGLPEPDLSQYDQAALAQLLDGVQQTHRLIPSERSAELIARIQERLEDLRGTRGQLDPAMRRDVLNHVKRWRNEEGNLIMILHAIQDQHGYVPRAVAMELARELGVKLARIYEVITFYHYFKLSPQGEHNLTVCNGTACYLKGAANILAAARQKLGINEGETSPDRKFHLDVVRCIGCCGMSPAVVLDDLTHGRVKPDDIDQLVDAAVAPTATKPEGATA